MPQVSVCPQCGASVRPTDTRCEYCGSFFEDRGDEPEVQASSTPPPKDPAVAGLRALHKELDAYSGRGSSWTMGAGFIATLGAFLGGLLWWRIGILLTVVLTVVTGFVCLMLLGVHLSRERARHFDKVLVHRLEALEAEHGLVRAQTVELAKHHLPGASDLRDGIEKTVKKVKSG